MGLFPGDIILQKIYMFLLFPTFCRLLGLVASNILNFSACDLMELSLNYFEDVFFTTSWKLEAITIGNDSAQ